MKITKQYRDEKIEAYIVAIEGLRMHESDSDIPGLSEKLRNQLADKLERELDRWIIRYPAQSNE